MLSVPIEYLIAIVLVALVGAALVGGTTYGVLQSPLCPTDQPDCDADVILTRLVGGSLAILIFALPFGWLLHYLIRKGMKKKKEHETGIVEQPIDKPKLFPKRLFIAPNWWHLVLVGFVLHLGYSLMTRILPFYLSFTLTVGAVLVMILFLYRRTSASRRNSLASELFIVLLSPGVVYLILRDLIVYPYSIPIEVGAMIIVAWLIRRHSLKSSSSQEALNPQQ